MRNTNLSIVLIVLTLFLNACNTEQHNFKARALIVLSDADMIASSYEDGVLNKNFQIEDSLTVLSFNHPNSTKSQISLSNSVIGWPSVFSYSPKTQLGYFAETKGSNHQTKIKMQRVWDALPDGGRLFVVDLSNIENPRVVQQEKLGNNVFSVSVNSTGTVLASSVIQSEKTQILLSQLEDGKIVKTFLADTSIFNNFKRITSLYFHPSKDILAVNLDNTSIGFYRITRNNNTLGLEPIGGLLKVSIRWSEGKWFNNGDFFAVCDYAFTGLDKPRVSSIKSIKFDVKGNHELISEVKTGLSTEGFDLSPDNQYIVAVNMERSFLPPTYADSLFIRPSLTLIKVSPNNGKLERLGANYSFDGALPEDAAFDSESNTVAVVSFHEMKELNPRKGKVEFWEIQHERLIKLDAKVELTRGAHFIHAILD
ncbi:MAG: hypothetical protein HWE15_05660 [Algoriphagus sp.]|uniref:hypothetical protein n=1 Tax=Algoriphagus sp. TaxID=1872435 RepID=UPI001816176F|nr:hypothetical protein [Algoriphagus sp.]NVJ85772.1 hypothetical protein [Algoriphagus sp.]